MVYGAWPPLTLTFARERHASQTPSLRSSAMTANTSGVALPTVCCSSALAVSLKRATRT